MSRAGQASQPPGKLRLAVLPSFTDRRSHGPFRFHRRRPTRGLLRSLQTAAHRFLRHALLPDTETGAAPEGEVIDISEPAPRRIPSKKWRELIKKVWEADPLLCPHGQHEMRIVALIDQADVIERILRHLGLWAAGVRVESARDLPEPAEPVIEPWLDDPFPNYDHEPVFAQI